MRRLLLVPLVLLAAPVAAQTPVRTASLTIEEAVTIARRNNPQYQQAVNARQRTGWALRTSRASLLPTLGAGMSFGWREGRQTFIEGQPFGAAADILSSNYGLNLNLSYSYSTFLNPRAQAAQLDASDANVLAQEQSLRQQVANQYLLAVEAERTAELQDSLVKSRQLQLDFAQAKERLGSGTVLETKNAQVAVYQVQLNALTAHNRVEIEKARLFQILGVPQPGNVALTTELRVVEPVFNLDELLAEANTRNATLVSSRAQERAAEINRRAAISQYIPSMSFSTGLGGSTNQLTNASGDDKVWPFGFDRNPLSFSVGFQIPIFNGLQREAQVQNAAITLSDRQQDLRNRELQLRSDITATLLQLRSDWQSIQLQNLVVATARDALDVAEERYRVGSTSYLELTQAVDNSQNAENARLRAIYQYHRDFAALEAAVGRPLR